MRRRTYLEHSSGADSILAADPTSHVIYVGYGGGDGDEADGRAASLHTRDDDLEGASPRFIQNMNLYVALSKHERI